MNERTIDLYLHAARQGVPPWAQAVADALVDAQIATETQGKVFVEAIARQEATRRMEYDQQQQAKRDRRRGLARLLNIGQ
jgi:hypothetical protein